MTAAAAKRSHAADAGSVDARNPWPGLASFREADREFFRGREAESEALVRLLRRARLTVLFGLSGLGKTSLLRAGVFPRIRGEDVLPVLIRLDHSAGSPPLADQVRRAVAGAADEGGVEGADSLGGASLWETFHRRDVELWSERHKLVVPLLVFDQFEEIFTLGRRDAATRAASEAFLRELADLAEARPPESLKARLEDDPGIGRELNFGRHAYKVLLSLREDFLPQLEELREQMGSLAHNRFRLRPMNGEAALSVVAQVPELIDTEIAEQVVRFVAAADPTEAELSLRELQVEPALLSVVCRELNNRRRESGAARITSGLLEEGRGEILAGIYERSVADVPEELRRFVEERLLTVSGYRDSVALENAIDQPGIGREHLDRLVDRRLLRIEERGGVQRIELTHDLLTGVAAHSRDERRHREQEREQRRARLEAEAEAAESRRKLRRSRVMAAVFLALAVVSAVLAAWAVKERRRATSLAAGARAGALLIAAEDHADPLVRRLLLTEMTDSIEPPRGLRRARRAVEEAIPTLVLNGHGAEVERVAFSPSGDHIVTVSRDGKVRLWMTDGTDRDHPVVLDGHGGPVVGIAFSPSGDHIVTGSTVGTARFPRADRPDREGPLLLEFRTPRLRNPAGAIVTSEVQSVALSSSGDHVVTGYWDGSARLWSTDGSDRDEPVVLEGQGEPVVTVAFSPSGGSIVTGSQDGTARLWRADGPDRKDPIVVEGNGFRVESVAFSRSGEHVVTGYSDGTARLWRADGSDHDGPVVLEGHRDRVSSVAFSPSGDQIVTGSLDGTARLWRADGSNRDAPVVLEGHGGRVWRVAFSPSGNQIATGSDDGTARLWRADGSDRGEPVVLGGHGGAVRSVAFSPSGDQIVTGSDDGTARLWRADGSDRGEPVVLGGHGGVVLSVAFSPSGDQIATRSGDGAARLWRGDGWDRDESLVLEGDGAEALSVAFSPSGDHIVTGSLDGIARLWRTDGSDHDDPAELECNGSPVLSVAFSPSGDHIVTGSLDGIARVWRADGFDRDDPIVLEGNGFSVESVAFSPSGDHVVTGSRDGTVRLWRADGSDRDDFFGFEGNGLRLPVSSVAFRPSGDHIVAGSGDGTVRLWRADGSDRDHPLRLEGHLAAFSLSGDHIVSGSEDGTVRLWRVDGSGGDAPVVLGGHGDPVWSVAFSPSGDRIVAGSSDGTVRVWRTDGSDRDDPIVLEGHQGGVRSVAFSPSGDRIVTGSDDGTARIWRVTWPALLDYLRGATTECLTAEQRSRYLNESDPDALFGYQECERSHGRLGPEASSRD